MSSQDGLLHLTLNAGLLESSDTDIDAEKVRIILRDLEDEFREANSDMRLDVILDQPSDAHFIMERMSRRNRGPLPQSAISIQEVTGSPSIANHQEAKTLLQGIKEQNPYYIKHREGIFFLATGLQIYAGGQVHYDLMLLSDPIIDDRTEYWICCDLRKNVKNAILFAAPGRSALDGVAVTAGPEKTAMRTALQRLIAGESGWALGKDRLSFLRLYGARNGELDRSECSGLPGAERFAESAETEQRPFLEKSIAEFRQLCGKS